MPRTPSVPSLVRVGRFDTRFQLSVSNPAFSGPVLARLPPARCSWYTSGDSDNGMGSGIFSYSVTAGGTTVSTDIECKVREGDTRDCADSQAMKCDTNKAFIIIGILANAAALGLVVSGAGPAIAPVAAGGFASFSYMIVWALFAANMNASIEDCGLDGALDYGAAFGCTIVAWLVCAAGAAASMMAAKAA